MGLHFEEGSAGKQPITAEPAEAAGADSAYIENEVRRIHDRYEGEARIARLVDFISLSLAEATLTLDYRPGLIRTERDEKAQLLRLLAPGILPPNTKL